MIKMANVLSSIRDAIPKEKILCYPVLLNQMVCYRFTFFSLMPI